MSALMAERRELADDGRQESLFEAHAPPAAPAHPWALPPEPPPREEAPAGEVEPARGEVGALPRDEVAIERRDEALAAPPEEAIGPPPDDAFEVVVAPATEGVGERRAPLSAGTPLAGPTLDDVMSRVWEGLVTGLPAACPVCRGEVEPTLGGPLSGRCPSCHAAID